MRWFDTHCHIDRIPTEPEKSVSRAGRKGVDRILVPGVSGFPRNVIELLKYSSVSICWGIHPCFIEEDLLPVVGNVMKTICNNTISITDNLLNLAPIEEGIFFPLGHLRPAAIGECGLDKRSLSCLETQIKVFEWQLKLAVNMNIPVIIHIVGYYQKVYDILSTIDPRPVCVLHSWTGSLEMAVRFIGLGAFISISGSALKRPERVKQLISNISLEKLLIETDSPDQLPPFLNQDYNEPAMLPQIAAAISEYSNLQISEFSEVLYENSIRVFGVSELESEPEPESRVIPPFDK